MDAVNGARKLAMSAVALSIGGEDKKQKAFKVKIKEMLMKRHLTSAFVKRAQCSSGRSKEEFTDTELPGFRLEVSSSGSKSYYLFGAMEEKSVYQRDPSGLFDYDNFKI